MYQDGMLMAFPRGCIVLVRRQSSANSADPSSM